MKKIILTFAGILVLSTAMNAQANNSQSSNPGRGRQFQNKSPEDRAKRDTERATARLGLDASQQAKWQAASLERINANEPLRAQMEAAPNQTEKQRIGAQMKENMKKFDDNVNGFLTADQKTKWEQEKSEKKSERRSKRNGAPQTIQQ